MSPQPATIEKWLRQLISRADPTSVADGFDYVRDELATNPPKLVRDANVFCDIPTGGSKEQREADAPAYFAAASVLHLEDGWSYLGRSAAALMRGDRGAAAHCAYYAELRAGLALLVGAGLLNRNYEVFSLDANATLKRRDNLDGGTHELVWQLIDRWTRESVAQEMLGTALNPFGVALGDWLDVARLPLTASPTATAQEWFAVWALDLRRFAEDRNTRNLFSYNPTATLPKPPFDAEQFVTGAWWLLEPAGSTTFEALDRHLLRAVIDSLVHAAGDRAERRERKREEFIAAAESTLALPSAPDWKLFLSHQDPYHDPAPLIEHATRDSQQPWEVMARATILLRLATGATQQRLSAGPLLRGGLEPWAQFVVTERQLGTAPVRPLSDLWADIEDALQHLDDGDYSDQHRTEAMRRRLETCERVALWSLAA